MAGYTYVSPGDRGDRDRQRDPSLNSGGTPIEHEANEPRYGTGSVVASGMSVYPKVGGTVIYFEDSAGTKQVGPSGGKGGQASPPSRTGLQLVGFTTGKNEKGYLQVSWVNTWYQDFSWKAYIPFATPKLGGNKSESKISWVKLSAVDVKAEYQTESDIENEQIQAQQLASINQQTGMATGGIDTTTIGILAVGAALFLKKRKK